MYTVIDPRGIVVLITSSFKTAQAVAQYGLRIA